MPISRSPSPAARCPSSLKVARTRPRTNTDELLPQNFDHASSAIPLRPIPETVDEAYTQERLQSSLAYTVQFLKRRDISPRSENFMKIFKNELTDTLSTTNPEEKKSGVTAVRVYEKLIEQNAFLWVQRVSQNLQLETNLLELREFQYFARYGDYMKILPMRLRQHACERKTGDWELLSGKHYWSDIAVSLKNEDATLKNIRFNDSTARETADYRTHAAVCNASRSLGISEEVALWSIIEYGLRNGKVHRDLEALRAEGDFQQLANVFSADIEDLDLVFSESRSDTDKERLKSVITTEIQRWFRVRNMDDPRTWIPREELVSEYEKLKANKQKPSKSEQRQINILHDEELRHLKAARRTAAETNLNPESKGPKKRVASTEEPKGSEEDKRKREQRRLVLMTQVCKLRRQLENVQMQLGELSQD